MNPIKAVTNEDGYILISITDHSGPRHHDRHCGEHDCIH